MEATMPTKRQLEEQNAELLAINKQLISQVPERIRELIEESEVFSEFIKNIDEKSREINQTINKAEQVAQDHIDTLQQKRDELGELETNLANKEQEAIKAISELQTKSIEAVQTELENSQNEITSATEESVKNINDLTEAFKQLAGTAYYNKSSDKIADEYRKNAESHQDKEAVFQKVGARSILFAIVVLIIWLVLVNYGEVSTEAEYHWLPVATITSLFIFLSRWFARIAYRHGLEARRLNQFALDLTAMPAFFAQELLNQGDAEFQADGKKIIQAKASKMFGNIERFDEQHSHSPMELVWKWVTKKFESDEEKEVLSSLSNSQPNTQPKSTTTPKAKKSAPSTDE